MKYFSTFSGIAGFELGIEKACPGAVCVGYSEIDKYADAIYKYHFKEVKNYGDITKINEYELPDFDLLVGGFPCQAFSIAGKRKGFEDTRGTLFFDLARILQAKRPRLFIFENVKGLLSHDGGSTFRTIITTLDELGYDVQWQVLNSKNFGVPQNRERIIIVGNLRGTPRPEVFPIGLNETKTSGKIKRIVDGYQSTSIYSPDGVSVTLASEGGGLGAKTGLYAVETTGRIKQIIGGSQGYRVYDPNGISTTLASEAGGVGAKTGLYAVPVLTPEREHKRQNGRRFKEPEDPSFTLTAQDRQGVMCSATAYREIKAYPWSPTITASNYKHPIAVLDDIDIRKLTPVECEKLQGFPCEWTKYGIMNGEVVEMSDSRRYKALGNAVTTNVIEAVMRRIVA